MRCSRLQIPALVFCLICLTFYRCHEPVKAPSSPDDAETEIPSYEESMATNAAVRFNYLGDSLFRAGDYPAAIALYQRSMDSAAVNADSFPYYDSKLDLACVHDRLGEFQTAIQMTEPVVEAFIRSGDSTRIGRAYTTLAGFYGKAKMPGKSLENARRGFDVLKNDTSLIHRCSAYNQMAFIYSDQEQWAAALPLLDSALMFMQASGILDQLPSMYLNLGDCHRKLGQWPKARYFLSLSTHMADSLQQTHVCAKAIERLSQVAEAVGEQSLALKLFKQSASLKDSVLNKGKIEKLQALEVAYQTREKEFRIASLLLEKQIADTRRNLFYTLAALASLALGFTLFQLYTKLKNSRKTLQGYHQELKLYTDLLLAKNTRLLELETALQEKEQTKSNMAEGGMEMEPDDSGEESEMFYNNRILTPEDWELFRQRFDNAYPGYLLGLRSKEPNLSAAEERLFLLIKLGFNTQEIAFTLGISPNGVKKGRQRLRKKLNLRMEDDLDRYIFDY